MLSYVWTNPKVRDGGIESAQGSTHDRSHEKEVKRSGVCACGGGGGGGGYVRSDVM